ncbi:Protein of unknown function [Gryllus bimaculatus]|nr:Protein of unknown function [Gryllus bimaculatus]
MVNRISNAFQKMFVEDTPDIIPMDAESNLKKKRDLGMDAETDLFQIGVFDDRDVPLGNKDSLSFINALERFRRKPSIIEVPVYPPKLIYVRSDPYKQIDHRGNVNLDASDDTNKEETYSSVSSNETEWVNDTSKDADTNSALMDISKEGETVPPEEYVNKSIAESLPQEIPDEDWETAQQDLLKADAAPKAPEVFSEGRGTPVPALMGEELSKEEGDPALKTEAEGQLAFVGGGVLLRVASGEAAGSPVAGDAGAGGREGDGSAAGVTGKTQTAEVRAARSRLHVALGALGVVAVALLVAATPVVQRVVVTMWYPRPRDVDRFGEDGDGDDCGGDAGDDEMLVPSGKTKAGWKCSVDTIITQLLEASIIFIGVGVGVGVGVDGDGGNCTRNISVSEVHLILKHFSSSLRLLG